MIESRSMRVSFLLRRALMFVAALLVLAGAVCHDAKANIIYVTTLDDKVSSTGGCSLKEAIFASNLQTNSAISSYGDIDFSPYSVTTQCVPGSGNDIIVLPVGGLLQLTTAQEDAGNYMGPTATPMITSTVTIEGYGATLQYAPPQVLCSDDSGNYCTSTFRAFAVGTGGNLTIENLYIKGFQVQGGSGASGGGGGLGAGGAIYFNGTNLKIDSSTFDSNAAMGGNGSNGAGGGGGGLGGNGSSSSGCLEGVGYGGGGGGASGDGGSYNCSGHGGGGTVFGSAGGSANSAPGGFNCGGNGGVDGSENGQDATCPGGGGGGGFQQALSSGNGGRGNYGGGGGGGADGGGNGGGSVFGGGGGAGWTGYLGGTTGGTGGFGGGGGAAQDGNIGGGNPGAGGTFGGKANKFNGGGGGALGGAIFNDSGTVIVTNSTFTGNHVARGDGGSAGAPGAADNGADAGGAIFSVNGPLTIQDATISGNQSTGSAGGVAIIQTLPSSPTSLTLLDTIIFNNGANECSIVGGTSVTVAGAGNLVGNNNNCPGLVDMPSTKKRGQTESIRI